MLGPRFPTQFNHPFSSDCPTSYVDTDIPFQGWKCLQCGNNTFA
uniref:Uncharacterized protein n=1 Tax=Anguilla anguilla TaxID=7936 RepID=A0A0E9SH44_ANGAN